MAEDVVRVLRVIEYVGPRSWVEATVEAHGTKSLDGGRKFIRATTIGVHPEILLKQEEIFPNGQD